MNRGVIKHMTICIAVKADNGKSLVLMADQLATNFSREVDGTEKIIQLKPKIYMMLSGDDALGRETAKITQQLLANHDTDDSYGTDECAQLVRNAIAGIRNRLTEDLFLRTRGLTHDTYIDNQRRLHKDVVASIDGSIQNYVAPEVNIIVAGIDSDGEAHSYKIVPPGIYLGEAVAFDAVGSGASHAESTLYSREYKISTGLDEATFLAYEAKKDSEIAPGVGERTTAIVVTSTGATILNEEKIEELDAIYKKVQESKKQEITDMTRGLRVLTTHISTNYHTGMLYVPSNTSGGMTND